MTNQSFEYKNITAAGTATLIAANLGSASQGVLHNIVIAKPSAQVVTVYDGDATTGTVIQTFPASAPAGTYAYDVVLTKGLTIVAAASYAGDLTASFQKGYA